MIFWGKWKGFKIVEYMYFTLCRPTSVHGGKIITQKLS